ncbi:hypothetical protein A8990_101390 [Paenibacillus taihuensis]|uniref:Uncharacterized protein n=1 Tax=Paenibacillus taihuensis TaxID=1156355 RepID=A0A3D9SPU7_9BACL|nr:hypothetical protein A8990_101390 [Paenibacillus taihuensis]
MRQQQPYPDWIGLFLGWLPLAPLAITVAMEAIW